MKQWKSCHQLGTCFFKRAWSRQPSPFPRWFQHNHHKKTLTSPGQWCERWSQIRKRLSPTGVSLRHIMPTTFSTYWKGISWFMRWKGCAGQQLSNITSRSHTTSLDMTSLLSRIFHHDSRTCNCHWDGLCQERTPSEGTRRHMDVSYYLTLMPPSLIVLCWMRCSDIIFVLRVIIWQ